jgi:hypothetical protein
MFDGAPSRGLPWQTEQRGAGYVTMADDPVDLDGRRGKPGLKATKDRRQRLEERLAQHAALEDRQAELERLLMAGPAETPSQAIARARYLLQLFAATDDAQEPRRRELIALALEDLTRLCEDAKTRS